MNFSPIYGLWDLEEIRAISSMDMKHVSISGTGTFVYLSPYGNALGLGKIP